MAILVTGATGYIGSHTVVELLKNNYEVVGIDNFSNSSPEVLNRINEISGRDIAFYEGDVADTDFLKVIFQRESIEAVVHFAAYKSVSESVANPLKYYHKNLMGFMSLCEVMQDAGVKTLVFSSSATVYGENNAPPFKENAELSSTNPYGETKVMIERMLKDLVRSDACWKIVVLRYFNPVGAHPSGLIGEDPKGLPSNLMPYITQVAAGKLGELSVFGNRYKTLDGTGVRDYIHIQDLAFGHIKAVEYIKNHKGLEVFNLGSNKGYSVLEVIKAFEEATGLIIPYKIVDNRPGDVGVSYADCSKAADLLKWHCKKNLVDMCRDAWKWQMMNPAGYEQS